MLQLIRDRTRYRAFDSWKRVMRMGDMGECEVHTTLYQRDIQVVTQAYLRRSLPPYVCNPNTPTPKCRVHLVDWST